jgi:uncharacterized surface protein with fasciclin (FAS1) repeats
LIPLGYCGAIKVIFLSLFAFACQNTTETASADKSEAGKTKDLGQAGVSDELSAKNILQIAIGSADHSTLVAGVKAAGLEAVLANNGPITVFAPTNAAFDALPEGTLDNLLKPENKATLATIITFHAAPGNYDEKNIKGVMGIGQATGHKVKVTVEDGVTYVNGAKVLGSVKAANGYVHVIDAVLLPPE